ncbi:MAG: hypothetical protein FJ288_06490 [Planctomycetes bacterium]|nr:hypothetical protein [Planctomycetota bacterium]
MVRPVGTRTGAWKAGLAVAVVAAGLLWHILACTESPMAFSPSGKDLAFVTMEPYSHDDDLNLAGTRVYRLMVLSEGRNLRVLEETSRYMLTAPAWSPDGRHIAYLRILLLEKEQRDRLKEVIEKNKGLRDQQRSALDADAWRQAPLPPAAPGAAEPEPRAPDSTEDISLPPAGPLVGWAETQVTQPRMPAILVIRDARTGRVVSATRTASKPVDHEAMSFFTAYLTLRPQYSTDGHIIYWCTGSEVVAVNPEENKQWTVVAPASVAALSPDGATIAALGGSLVLCRPQDNVTVHRRIGDDDASLSGLAWVDKDTVAILRNPRGTDARLDLFRADGTPAKSIPLKLPEHETKDSNTGELAVAPSGSHMVLAFGKDVFFLKMDGTILRHWKGEAEVLAQPTFTPDSRQVAMKLMTAAAKDAKEPDRASAIVFFSPDGKELSRADVPAARLPAPAAEK